MKEKNIMTGEQLTELDAQVYRLEAVLKAAQDICPDNISIDPDELRTKLSTTTRLIETGRLLLWEIHNIVDDASGNGRGDKPSDL